MTVEPMANNYIRVADLTGNRDICQNYEQKLSTMPNKDLYGEIETLKKWTE